MATYFDITAVATSLTLDEERKGRGSFTVTNTVDASIGGDAVIVPEPGTDASWFNVDGPSRTYNVDEAEQIAVDITVPADAVPGRYGFRLRVLLGGGVPEEQFDDGPVVSFEVVPEPEPLQVEPSPGKPFPWWLVAVIGGIAALVIIVGALVFVLSQGDGGRLVFKSAANGGGTDVCTLAVEDGPKVLAVTDGCSDNQARSLVLENVADGVSVNVFDSQVCARSAHWTEVDVTDGGDPITVNSFETNVAAPPVAVTYHQVRRQNVISAIDSDAISDRLAVTDVEAIRSMIEARDPGEGEDLVLELDPSFVLPDDLLELARDREVVIWDWPPAEDTGGVDGRVSCVDIATGS